MIESTVDYKKAVVADARRTYIKAIVNIVDPDIIYGTPGGSDQVTYSKPEQIHDEIFDGDDNYQTMELNRTILDGSYQILGEEQDVQRQIGYVGDSVCDENGVFDTPQVIMLNFSGVSVLQALTVAFPINIIDGTADTFSVSIVNASGETTIAEFTGNRENRINIDDFTVNSPTAIKVVIDKWSLPYRRVRILEIFPGIHEEWDNSDIAALNIRRQANFTSLALPYGTCTLSVDNSDRRFEPANKDGIFKSIEERQGIDLKIGVQLPGNTVEYKGIGQFYQYSGGWRTGNNGLTIQWNLVDIIGMIADRQFIAPEVLPNTIDGWVQSIVSQIGANFTEHYIVDATLSGISVTAYNRDSIGGRSCGEILRYACMAVGGYASADASTGKLAVRPLRMDGGSLTLDNMESYPVIRANDDIAAIVFKLYDGYNTEYIVAGNSPSSNVVISVDNPFIRSSQAANKAAAVILKSYGGNIYDTVGRGNPATEIGDVETVEISRTRTGVGRVSTQTFAFSGGVLRGCGETLIEVQ